MLIHYSLNFGSCFGSCESILNAFVGPWVDPAIRATDLASFFAEEIKHQEQCVRSPLNPCYAIGNGICSTESHNNKDFDFLTVNRLNHTCKCDERGFK